MEDYIEAQSDFASALDKELERFARNLGDDGAVVRPFTGDIEKVWGDVLDKNWTYRQAESIKNTPAMIMIEKDFVDFDPQSDRWLLFHFGDRHEPGWGSIKDQSVVRYRALLHQIAEAVTDGSVDPFEVAHKAYVDFSDNDAGEIFQLEPGVFGLSFNVRAAGRALTQRFRASRSGSRDV